MARLKLSLFVILLALLMLGCGRAPDFWDTYNATMTAAAVSGTGGQPTPASTPHPGIALLSAGLSVTQAAASVQSAQTVLDQTRTSYEYAAAVASLEAQQAIATQVAPATFAAATATQAEIVRVAAEVATQGAIRTTVASSEANVAIAQANAQMTIVASSAGGTATAIAGVAGIEEMARQAQQEQLAIANQRAQAKAVLSWLVPVMLTLCFVIVTSAWSYRFAVRSRPQAIDDRPYVTWDHSGTPMLSAPRRAGLLSANVEAPPTPDTGIPDGTITELPDLLSNVLQVGLFDGGRPVHLGPGFMGIQVTGEKGSGKSSLLRLMASQALVHGWEIFLCDAEALSFDPALWGPVAQSTNDARLLFTWLRHEVFAERHRLFREAFTFVEDNLPAGDRFLVDNLKAYNEAAALFNMPKLKPMLLVWDEANSHLKDKKLQELVEVALQASRKVGCDSVVAGHDWRADHIPTGLKLQLHNAIVMRCSPQDSDLILKDKTLASSIPADSPGMAYIRIKRYQGYMQTYHLPDPRLINMVRGARPRNVIDAPWTVVQPTRPALTNDNEMGLDELFELGEGGESEARPRKLDPKDPYLRQRVLELSHGTKPDGSPYSQRDVELAITTEFCPHVTPYAGGQAYKVVKEILSSASVVAAA